MNKFSIYQYALILLVLVLGSIYALPNLYPTQPSIQVAFCIALPPCISKVIFTCEKPLSSKPVFALVTRSPVTTTAFSKKAVWKSLSLKLNSSFLKGGVHVLLEVDIDTAQEGRLELLLDTYRRTFKEEKIKYDSSSIRDLSLYFQLLTMMG